MSWGKWSSEICFQDINIHLMCSSEICFQDINIDHGTKNRVLHSCVYDILETDSERYHGKTRIYTIDMERHLSTQ